MKFEKFKAASSSQEAQKEKQETKEEQIEKKFEKLFGITPKDLKSIPEYEKLTVAQRSFLLQNMENWALEHINFSAIKQYKEEQSEASCFSKIARSLLKRFYIEKAKHQTAKNIATLKTANLEMLQDFAKMMKASGIEVYFDKDEKLKINYITSAIASYDRDIASRFNTAVERLLKVTQDAQAKSKNTLPNQEDIKAAEMEYQLARKELITAMIKGRGLSKSSTSKEQLINSVLTEIAEIEKVIRMNQFLNNHPSVEKELSKITSKQFWTNALFNTALERGAYFSFGWEGRAILVGALNVFAAPVVAAASGAMFGRRRAIQTLNEELQTKKLGEKSKILEALENKTKQKGLFEAKAFVDAKTLTQKIDSLMEKIKKEDNAKEKAKLMYLLDRRLYYTRYLLDNRLIKFSGEKEKLMEQYELITKLAEGEVNLQFGTIEVNQEMEKRLDTFLEKKAKYAKAAQKSYIYKEMIKGAAWGATFALIGSELRSLLFGVKAPEAAHQVLEAQQGGKSGEAAKVLMTETTNRYEATIAKGSNIWDTAEKIAKEHHLSKEEFAKAWVNKESAFTTIDGKKVPISEMGLVHEGDKVIYVPGSGGKAGHFELIDTNHNAKTNWQYYELLKKKKETPPEWLRKALGITEEKNLGTKNLNQIIEETPPAPPQNNMFYYEEIIPSPETHSISHDEFFSYLVHNDIPRFENYAENFHHYSLADQETILKSSQMDYLRDHINAFRDQHLLTENDVDLISKLNQKYAEMTSIYDKTLQNFKEFLKTKTGIQEGSLEKFLSTKIKSLGSIDNEYQDNEKIMKFIRSINITPSEFTKNLSIGEILKSRFFENEFYNVGWFDGLTY